MDQQIIGTFAVPTLQAAQITTERFNAPSVLRGIENGSLHFVTVPTTGRDQEFIDHSLLSPNYISTQLANGSFIIDLATSNSHNHTQNFSSVTSPTQNTSSVIQQIHLQPQSQQPSSSSVIPTQQQQQQSQQQPSQPPPQQHQQHFQIQQNDDDNSRFTFLQFVDNKPYPVKITSNEAQVIVTNKDVIAHNQQEQQQNLNSSIINCDNQFRMYTTHHIDSSPTSACQVITETETLPVLTPIPKSVRQNRKCTNTTNIQNTNQIAVINSNNFELTQIQSQQIQQRPLAKKNLPHKKRIAKKLKIIDKINNDQQQSQQQQQQQNHHQVLDSSNEDIQQTNITVFHEESNAITIPQFSCQICGNISETQWDFFTHLKGHYEPNDVKKIEETSSDTIQNDSVRQINKYSFSVSDVHFDDNLINENIHDNNNLEIKTLHHHNISTEVTDDSNENNNLNKIEQNVYHNDINETNIVNKIHHSLKSSESSNLSLTAIKSNDDGGGLLVQKTEDVAEIEFSDTEDMLEGIRGVVDKVQESVDNDSNDCMNLINVERPWFANTVINHGLDGHQAENFGLFNRTDIEKLIEQEEQSIDEEVDRNDETTYTKNDISLSDHMIPIKISFATSCTNNEIQKTNFNIEKLEKENCTLEKPAEKGKRGRKPKYPKVIKKSNSNKIKTNKQNDLKQSNEIYDLKDHNNQIFIDDAQEKFETKKRLQCVECDKVFNSLNALKYHNLSHTGERPFQCEHCGKGFFARSALQVHMRLHSGDKPYECEICQHKFRQWGDLKYHVISKHTNLKSYQCEFCGKAFARRYSLVVHRRIHTKEKNYKCEFCTKSFRASSYLQNHRKIHTGEKPYACKFCGKKFRVGGDLRRHEKIHTRDKKKYLTQIEPMHILPNNDLLISNQKVTNDNLSSQEFTENAIKSEIDMENIKFI